jgi:hypothetical protein
MSIMDAVRHSSVLEKAEKTSLKEFLLIHEDKLIGDGTHATKEALAAHVQTRLNVVGHIFTVKELRGVLECKFFMPCLVDCGISMQGCIHLLGWFAFWDSAKRDDDAGEESEDSDDDDDQESDDDDVDEDFE